MSFLELPFPAPDPVTVMFLGYFVAPVDYLAKAALVFIPTSRKSRATRAATSLNTLLGACGCVVWIWALLGRIDERAVFLPPAPSLYDFFLASAGLFVFLASVFWVVAYYVWRVNLDPERTLSLAGGVGMLMGILGWLLTKG